MQTDKFVNWHMTAFCKSNRLHFTAQNWKASPIQHTAKPASFPVLNSRVNLYTLDRSLNSHTSVFEEKVLNLYFRESLSIQRMEENQPATIFFIDNNQQKEIVVKQFELIIEKYFYFSQAKETQTFYVVITTGR